MLRLSRWALSASCVLFLLSCQADEPTPAGDSSPLGPAAGGCKDTTINGLTSNRTLLGYCGSIEKDRSRRPVQAGITEYRAFVDILGLFSPGGITVGEAEDAIELEQAFCALMPASSGFECPPWEEDALTEGGVAVVVDVFETSPETVNLFTPNGKYAVLINWTNASGNSFGVSLTQLGHGPDWIGDCTGLDTNSAHDCGNVPGVELLMHPVANFLPATTSTSSTLGTASTTSDSKIGICTAGNELIATESLVADSIEFPPTTTEPCGLTACGGTTCPTVAQAGGLRGLALRAIRPLGGLFSATPAQAGKVGVSLLHGSPYQGATTADRLGSVHVLVCSVFDRVSGADVFLKEDGTIVAQGITDANGEVDFSDVPVPIELGTPYEIEVFRNGNLSGEKPFSLTAASRNQTHEFNLQPPGHGGTTFDCPE